MPLLDDTPQFCPRICPRRDVLVRSGSQPWAARRLSAGTTDTRPSDPGTLTILTFQGQPASQIEHTFSLEAVLKEC